MKVALVYTSTTPELIELVEREVGKLLPQNTEIMSYQDHLFWLKLEMRGMLQLIRLQDW